MRIHEDYADFKYSAPLVVRQVQTNHFCKAPRILSFLIRHEIWCDQHLYRDADPIKELWTSITSRSVLSIGALQRPVCTLPWQPRNRKFPAHRGVLYPGRMLTMGWRRVAEATVETRDPGDKTSCLLGTSILHTADDQGCYNLSPCGHSCVYS